jgi:glycosyltransferase involved in cell wall biosynthesis
MVTFHEVWGRLWFELPYLSLPARLTHFLFERMLTLLPFHRYVAVSRHTAQRLRQMGVAPSRVRTIYNGIDYEEIRGILQEADDSRPAGKGGWTCTFFGRLGVSKGLDLLLPAFRHFSEEHPETRLRLILPRHPKKFLERIRRQVRDLELGAQVELRHDLPRTALLHLIRDSDAVVIPSYSEGFCFAAVEAMAVGAPVISSGRAALREVVGGRMLEMQEQSAQALAGALGKARAGHWEEKPLRRFPLQETVTAYLDCYEEIMR